MTGEVEDGRMEDCDETARHDVSTPLVTLKRLDDRTLVNM